MARQPTQEIAPEQREAARQQIIINTRLTALQCAQDMIKVSRSTEVDPADLIAYAKAVEAYILEGITSVEKRSALVITSQMPPPAAGFKPGD